ncbi:ATP-binding protein [Streptomyces sp. NPDC051567]|uniref:ATP-binding protein n=1 Tax=Streptomyces sp. NPDC051567 TaxID=3365660 RepID=UPI0037BB900D
MTPDDSTADSTADDERPAPGTTGHTRTTPLLTLLARLRDRAAELVERRSTEDPTADDPLRGLHLSQEAVRHLLGRDTGATSGGETAGAGAGVVAEAGGGAGRLTELAGRFGLTPLDVTFLLIALAPDLDRTFEPLYGYLNDDVGRRRATVGLALDLCGRPAHHAEARARFHPAAPLGALGLLTVEEPEHPFLSRSLRVPDRIVAHLLGDDTPAPSLAGHLREPTDGESDDHGGEASDEHTGDEHAGDEHTGFVARLAARITDGPPHHIYLRERREGDGAACVASALRTAGMGALYFAGPDELVPDLLREARLDGRAVVVTALPDRPAALVRSLTTATDVTVLITAPRPYDPHWCDTDPLVLEAPARRAGSVATWAHALSTPAAPPVSPAPSVSPVPSLPVPEGPPGFDLAATVAPYHLGGERITRAARAARALAAFDGAPLTAAHLRLGARQQSASGLEQHTRRIRPAVDWRDLVLPERPLTQLHELALRARHRDRVLGEWRLSAGGGRGRGVIGLFAGESGTGKTLAAEVVAAELGLDLYVVQLSSVVDKYVGETEKNLERIFSEADRTDAVLLFDEADAVFGRRSEVKDAHDRYANLESAYLLQRLETFDGIALLTTNLRANIDEAFTRRLDLVVDFPFPDAGQRLALWRHGLAHVPSDGGTGDDGRDGGDGTGGGAGGTGIGLEPLADQFELAGGAIRSAVVTAAYLAAGRDGLVTAADLLEGARREYRKAGRLVPGEGAW